MFVASLLSRFMHNLTKEHIGTGKKVLICIFKELLNLELST